MPLELRRADGPASAPTEAGTRPETGPGALGGLIAARLVTHEAIGDPARLTGEAATLRAICRLVAGPVYRIEPYHYAFALGVEDLGGTLGGLAPATRTAALQAGLADALGPEAIWIGTTDLPPGDAGETETLPEAALLVLGAHAEAIETGFRAAGPELQAVIDARYAVRCARLTAGAEAGAPLAQRLDAMETHLAEMTGAQAATGEAMARLSAALGAITGHLEAQSAALRAHLARESSTETRLAACLDEFSRLAEAPAAFQETLGLTLAEFLARLERRDVEAGAAGQPPRAG